MGFLKRTYNEKIDANLTVISRLSFSFLKAVIITKTLVFFIAFKEHFFEKKLKLIMTGFLQEMIFVSLVVWFLFLLSPILKSKFFRRFVFVLLVIVLTFELLSSFYYVITLEPISATLLNFSFSEMTNIAQDYWTFKWHYLLFPLPFLAFLLIYKKQKEVSSKWVLLFFIPAFLMLTPFSSLENLADYENSMVTNKTTYLFKSIRQQYQHEEKKDIDESIALYKMTNERRDFLSEDYPLLHKKSSENPLAPFFNLQDSPPNIVFIIVESLSSTYSGKKADEVSFTPFLDSLSQKSITFHNFFATAERTFAVLPSVLASLPHGKKGFNEMKNNYPDFYSLPEFLFQNKYSGTFFYGGHAGFDNMNLFLKHIGFSKIVDREEYNYEGTEYKTSIDPVPFGVGDKELFANSFETIKKREGGKPFFDVFLTLSMHYPYIIDNKERYLKKVSEIIAQSPESTNKKKLEKYKEELATFLYTDDALRSFFENYKSLPENENTIFLIVGDHMMGEIPQRDPLEKYRVPCIIFSPLLNQTKNILAVNSHLDIAPSFISLLEEKYGYSSPEKVHWLGSTFDTSEHFQNKRTLSFMLNNRKMTDFISENRFVSSQKVYELSENELKLNLVSTEEHKDLLELKKAYKSIHKYVALSNKILPVETDGEFLYFESRVTESRLEGDDEFMMFFNTPIKDSSLRLELKVNLTIKGEIDLEDESLPVLIVSVSDKSKTPVENKYWRLFELKDILYQKENSFELDLNLVIQSLEELDINPENDFNLYLWNKEKIDIDYLLTKKHITLKAK